MGDFWKYIACAVGLAVMALTLRTANKPFGIVFTLLAGAALLIALIDPLRETVETLCGIAESARIGNENMTLMLKMLGVSFASEFAAQACRDAGEEGIALRVELSAKLALVALSAPMLRQLAGLIGDLTA